MNVMAGTLRTALLAVCAIAVWSTLRSEPAQAVTAASPPMTSAPVIYLGCGSGVPPVYLLSGLGRILPWTYNSPTQSTASSAGWCSTSPTAHCSTRGFGTPNDSCSTAAPGGANMTCSSKHNGTYCSAAGPGGVLQECSTADNPATAAKCSAQASESVNSSGCSAYGWNGQLGTWCSALGTQSQCSSFGASGGPPHHCSTWVAATGRDRCSVVAGSGSECTAYSGAEPATCSAYGGSGLCSSFTGGIWGAYNPPGQNGICQ